VSYTEAAALRRYLGHGDDFLYLNTWLAPSVTAPESFMTLQDGGSWEGWAPETEPPNGALYELVIPRVSHSIVASPLLFPFH
jgi:hypothetical protein